VTECVRCGKPESLCVCTELPAEPLPHQTRVLILQHPQEPDHLLGSARLASLALANARLRVGLSWPNLAAALKEPKESVHPARWAVLYLGSGIRAAAGACHQEAGLHFVSKAGEPTPAPREKLEGIVLLDGTWSQAKAIWWRNAWLLKLKRVILVPRAPSLYKELRREPRRECLSTIETIAETLAALGEPAETTAKLKSLFSELLTKFRATARKR
jgi:DTW domain-containing protein YfiP